MNLPDVQDLELPPDISPDDPRVAAIKASTKIANDVISMLRGKTDNIHLATIALVGVLASAAKQTPLTRDQIVMMVTTAYDAAPVVDG